MSAPEKDGLEYRFEQIRQCEMCEAPSKDFVTMGVRQNRSQGFRPRRGIGIAVTVQRCSQCGLIFSNPMPVPKRMEMHYPDRPEEYWASAYLDEPLEQVFAGELATYRRLRPAVSEPVALDVGAGIGRSMAVLEQNGFRVTGVEPSPGFARRAIELHGFRPEQMVVATAEDTEFPENTFDFITLGASLEHLLHPGPILRKAAQWLKRDGLIHAEVPSSHWLVGRMINAFYRLTATSFVTNLSPMHAPFHMYEFSVEAFRRHGVLHGLEIESHDVEVCETQLPRVFDPFLKLPMRVTNTGLQLVVWLRRCG